MYDGNVKVERHNHPNAVELIIFNEPGTLTINGEKHSFKVHDAILLEPTDVHEAYDLDRHNCTCILLGKGEPTKALK